MNTELTHLWQLFYLYRNQLGYGLLSATINALAHYKHKDTARDSFVDVLFCGAIGWSVDHLLITTGMPASAGVIVAAMIGYVGADWISDFIKARLGLGGKTDVK